jgi:bifunctional isochorismate lyase/aryl carrier protein
VSGTGGRIPDAEAYRLDAVDWAGFDKVGWRLVPSRAALLIHDMQGFYTATVPTDLGLRQTVIANAAALLDACRASTVPVFYSVARPCATRAERGLLYDFYGMGMTDLPEQSAIVSQLAPAPGDQLITKKRYSAFFATDLAERLRAADVSQLIICGVYAHIGCQLTALDAFMRDIEVFYVADAMAAFGLSHHLRSARFVGEVGASVRTTRHTVDALIKGEPG